MQRREGGEGRTWAKASACCLTTRMLDAPASSAALADSEAAAWRSHAQGWLSAGGRQLDPATHSRQGSCDHQVNGRQQPCWNVKNESANSGIRIHIDTVLEAQVGWVPSHYVDLFKHFRHFKRFQTNTANNRNTCMDFSRLTGHVHDN